MLVLNGGSYYPESRKIDEEWIQLISKKDLIGFVPAATVRSEKEYFHFFRNQMANYELTNIPSIDLYNDWEIAIRAKVIFIAGGNTYKLMNIMNTSGFSMFISKKYKEKIIVGNSAGAVVFGEDIKTANSDDIIGMRDTKGLGLVKYSICPHYTKDKYTRLKNISLKLNKKVIGLPEKSAIVIDKKGERVINDIEIISPI
ncbi:Type 1 glutamine amidotransferase-like domain-containing protein [Abyssisolibacter fermentans]|uniref:Type 1 glutamine amidotransferase-like domain-containing protein n=1 Tax=Abyssisolibacter fermentans TaxID=1766203 RepID=UPI000836EAD6|nr:Type 1 glutamine amidotransferase-like domain-containing protein [Abyssisolibacter fermentans]